MTLTRSLRCGGDLLDLRTQSGDHRRWHPDIAQLLSDLLLAVFQAVEPKSLQLVGFARVFVVTAAEDPRVRDDRIRLAGLWVGNLDLQVVGDLRILESFLPRPTVVVGEDEPT